LVSSTLDYVDFVLAYALNNPVVGLNSEAYLIFFGSLRVVVLV